MATKFDLFRISLLTKDRPNLFTKRETRELFMRRVFSKPWKFEHYKNEFYYAPVSEADETLVGRIGRGINIEYNASPNEAFTKHSLPAWRASTVVIDPTDHIDGQKLAMEQISTVGRSGSILFRMFEHINRVDDGLFELNINPILSHGSFYEFASAQHSPVSFLSITFTPPNGLWTAGNSTREEVKEISKKTKATKVQTTISNPSGLDLNSTDLAEAISYAESGSGTIRAKTTSGNTFNSKSNQQVTTLSDNDSLSENEIEALAVKNYRQVLGR